MCTVIVTIRAVLWYVTSLVGTLLILVALFTNQWIHGQISTSNLGKKTQRDSRIAEKFLAAFFVRKVK